MLWIQIILLLAILGVAAVLNRSTGDARHQAIRRLLLLAFIVGAAASVIFPQMLSVVANWIGVGRGADLLLYALVIAFLGYIAANHRRSNVLSAQITALTRELTISRALLEDTARADADGPDDNNSSGTEITS